MKTRGHNCRGLNCLREFLPVIWGHTADGGRVGGQHWEEVLWYIYFIFLSLLNTFKFSPLPSPFVFVPAGSPSRGGDVTVDVTDVNQPSLPTPFYSVLVPVFVFMALSTLFHSINSPDNSSLFSLSSSVLNSALLVLSTIILFMKVSLSPDVILCGWLGLKHQLTD